MEKMPTKRQLQADAAKNRLRMAALELFAAEGFENVTVENICQKAQVSKGLFYNYYASKEEVLLERFVQLDDLYRQTMENFPPDWTVRQRMLALLVAGYHGLNDSSIGRQSGQITYGSAIKQGKSPLKDESRYFYRAIQEIIDYGRSRGQIPEGVADEDIVRLVQLCAWGGAFSLFLGQGSDADLEQAREAVDAILFRVLRDPAE